MRRGPYTGAQRAAVYGAVFLAAGWPSQAAYGQQGGSQAVTGAALYKTHCALCHGEDGRGGQGFPRPVWGTGHDLNKFGSALGLFEYIQLTMPFDGPQKLDDKQKMTIVAFLLERIGVGYGTELSGGNASTISLR